MKKELFKITFQPNYNYETDDDFYEDCNSIIEGIENSAKINGIYFKVKKKTKETFLIQIEALDLLFIKMSLDMAEEAYNIIVKQFIQVYKEDNVTTLFA